METRYVRQDNLRIAVVGVGHLGEYHVQKYRALKMVDLIGVVDSNKERAMEIGQRYNTKVFETHNDILDQVDAVSLAVPTLAHFDVAKDILSHGIHLLIEKPITYKLEPADTLIKMAKERNLVLRVGLVERFNPAVVKMESMLNNPHFIEARRMNIFTPRGTDVDVVLDLMIHDLDIILHIIPSEVKEIHAVGMSTLTDKTDIANVRLVFENGAAADLTASRVSHKTIRKIRVYQPESVLHVDCFKREFGVTRFNRAQDLNSLQPVHTEEESFSGRDPLADEIGAFVAAVSNGARHDSNGRDERKALSLSLQIIEQIKKGSKGFQVAH